MRRVSAVATSRSLRSKDKAHRAKFLAGAERSTVATVRDLPPAPSAPEASPRDRGRPILVGERPEVQALAGAPA